MIALAALLAVQAGADPAALAALLDGRWDNAAQVEAEADPARPHLLVIHEPFDNAALGGALVYAQLNLGGPDGEIYRQRVYAFTDAGEAGVVTMAAYEFADPPAYADAQDDPQRLAALSVEELIRFDPGCDFTWRREDGLWTGRIADGTCVRTSRRSGRDMVIGGEFSIEADRFTHSESGRYADDGEPVFAPPNGVPNLYDRAD